MSLAAERRAARERALGLLYEAETKGITGATVLEELPLAADELTVELLRAVDERRADIDALLSRYAEGWTLARMPALDRAALRMGTAELLARPEVPTGVVLAEAVDLASRFGTDGSGRFVNGLLARIAREVRGDAGTGAFLAEPEADEEPELEPLVDALIVDLDGVIRHWDQSYYAGAEERLGLPVGTFADVALEPSRLREVTDGRLSFEDWCRAIGEDLAARHGVDAAAAADEWASTTWRIDLDVLDLVDEAREQVPVVLLSNASTRLIHDLDHSDVLGAFDAVVGSADIRVAKPDAGAYLAAADAAGVSPEQCLFVDDTMENVVGARNVGMQAELFTGLDDLRTLLRSQGLVR